MLLYGASKVLCDYISKALIKYKNEDLNSNEKKILKDCIKALEALKFNDLYYNYNKRFEAIEEDRKPEYKVYKNNVFIKSFKTKKEAEAFYYELQPYVGKNEILEIIEFIKEIK